MKDLYSGRRYLCAVAVAKVFSTVWEFVAVGVVRAVVVEKVKKVSTKVCKGCSRW